MARSEWTDGELSENKTMVDRRRNRGLRLGRRSDFRIFKSLAADWFAEFARTDEQHEFFANIYSFYILRGGRQGGRDHRIFEVFFGRRPFDQAIEYTDFAGNIIPHPQRRLLSEEGPSLTYYQTASGTVRCFLRPAKTEGYARREDAILLNNINRTWKLTSKPFLKRHWKYLMSYCEVSSIDGYPTFFDYIRVGWLLLTRRLEIEGSPTRRVIWKLAEYGCYFLFVVGLNGFVVALVGIWLTYRGTGAVGGVAAPR